MTDFGEKAWEEGFSDEIEYLDYLCDETSKEMRREYQADLVEEERAEAAFLESKKMALALSNFDNIANSIGYEVIHDLGLKLHADDIDDSEVNRNLKFFNVKKGDVLDIIYTSKEDIIKCNTVFEIQFSPDDVSEDVYFIKHTNHHNMDIWVGSPFINSVETSYIIETIIREEYLIKAIVTGHIDEFNYTYCLIQHKIDRRVEADF